MADAAGPLFPILASTNGVNGTTKMFRERAGTTNGGPSGFASDRELRKLMAMRNPAAMQKPSAKGKTGWNWPKRK